MQGNLCPTFNILDDALRSKVIIFLLLQTAPIPPGVKHPHSIMLPPPSFTGGMVSGLQE